MEHKFEVRAIENGTVIDHLPSGSLFKIINLLDLEKETHRITFGNNLESKRMGTKAIIKITDRFCEQEEINRMALFAPDASVNIIKDYKVVEKRRVEVPESIEGFVRCANPKCVTNLERVKPRFTVIRDNGRIALHCRYCEKTTERENLQLIK